MASYLFNTLLLLNVIGSILYLLYKGLLYLAKDRINERFRYIGCISVMLLFLIPFYQMFPVLSTEDHHVDAISITAAEDSFSCGEVSEKMQAGIHLDLRMQKKILTIWAAGASLLAVWFISALLRFRWKLSKSLSEPVSDELQKIAVLCAREYKVQGTPVLKALPDVPGPMLYGFFRPVIAVPAAGISLADAPMILKHELVHFKRRDLWWKLLGVILQTIHWFNPFVWLLCKDLAFCTETSCDAEVVKNLDYVEKKHYGHLLISYVQSQHNLKPVPGISFTPARNKLKRRISLMLKGNQSRKMIAAAIVCTLTVSSFALSAFAADNQKDTPRTIDGIVESKNGSRPSNGIVFKGQVQKDIPFAEKINPNDGWKIQNKNSENSYEIDPVQIDLPPLMIPDEFREAVMRGEVEPFEIGEGVTVFPAE